jgi:cytochrome c5
MSVNEDPAHVSFIKRPKHLVIAIALGFAPAMSVGAIEERIQPVADADGGSAAGGRRTFAQVTASAVAKPQGKKVYEATCMACHAAGVANAPKFGDRKAWAPHLAHGVAELHRNALKGKGAMPPKGGNLTLSEAEVRAAVDYMLGAVK